MHLLFHELMTTVVKMTAMVDYIIGVWLIALPWLLGFQESLAPTAVSVLTGAGVIVNKGLSNEDYALVRIIPKAVHRLVDITTAVLLCLAPWMFEYSDIIIWPHVLTGLAMLAMLLTGEFDQKRKSKQ